LNDLEGRNGRYFALSTEFGGFNANYVKVDEDGHTLSAAKM